MYVSFTDKSWQISKLTYAYTNRFHETPVLTQCDGWVQNSENPSGCDQKYGYVSVVTKEKITAPVKIVTRFSFSGLAAPLITMVKDVTADDNGVLRYNDYKEIVVWKNGINVWDLWNDNSKINYHKLLGMEFNVTQDEIHTLEAIIQEDSFTFSLDGVTTTLSVDKMYPSFHLGITACEGICKFYDMEIGELA